ncbi:MAG: DMT family transporter [Bacteroidales bacterium]|nr:DMT family transporter [Bacteroidales bacterium]
MWILLALASACLLGFYDVFKKKSLKDNAVIPVLLINTIICSCIFMPCILGSEFGLIHEGSVLFVPHGDWERHRWIVLKAAIVLSSWISGYFAIKHLPITIVGPVNATRPIMALIGALVIFGEKLNAWQWAGVLTAIFAVFMLSRSGKKEGIDFKHDKWIFLLFFAAFTGAISGLYDKYLMAADGQHFDRLFAQGWYNFYQSIIMGIILLTIWLPAQKKHPEKFEWRWSIVFISLFLSAADLFYLTALSRPGAMIAVVSMARRSSVVVSFIFGAIVFHEKNLKGKVLDLLFVLLSMGMLLIGTL